MKDARLIIYPLNKLGSFSDLVSFAYVVLCFLRRRGWDEVGDAIALELLRYGARAAILICERLGDLSKRQALTSPVVHVSPVAMRQPTMETQSRWRGPGT